MDGPHCWHSSDPIYGIRAWLQTEGSLKSTGVDYRWPDVSVEAFHFTGADSEPPHEPADAPCQKSAQGGVGCGIYAYSTLAGADQGEYTGRPHYLYGVVLLWGKVFAAPLAQSRLVDPRWPDRPPLLYRGQFAEIVALDDSEVAREVAERYRLPRIARPWLLPYASERGSRAPATLWRDAETTL